MTNGRPSHFPPLWHSVLLTLAFLVPSILFVTNQSLWIDEAASCWFADHARGFNPNQFYGLAAVPEMPAYHLLLQLWVRLFGDSERALRGMNLPFAAIFLFSLVIVCASSRRRWWWLPAMPFAFYPMLLYYVNESRPYAAILALSTAAAGSLFLYLRHGYLWSIWTSCFACLGSFSMHLLGILAPVVLLLWLVVSPEGRRKIAQHWRHWIAPIALSLPCYLALGLYYLHVRGEGVPINSSSLHSDTPGQVTSNWKNIVFLLYETFGFDGLGPPRNDLRIHSSIHSLVGYTPLLLVGSIAIAILMMALFSYRTAEKHVSPAIKLLFCCSVGAFALFAVARAIHFGFFGRHAMALIGVAVCAFVMGLSHQGLHPRVRAAAVIALFCAWTLSSARLLLIYPYGKDDARSALRVAKASGLPILWNADLSEASYYGGYNPLASDPQFLLAPTWATNHWQHTTRLTVMENPSGLSTVSSLRESLLDGNYVLVTGKPDLFDSAGLWARALAVWHPRKINSFNGHDVWLIHIERNARP